MIRVMMTVWKESDMSDSRTMTVGGFTPDKALEMAQEWLRKAVGADVAPSLWGSAEPVESEEEDEDGS